MKFFGTSIKMHWNLTPTGSSEHNNQDDWLSGLRLMQFSPQFIRHSFHFKSERMHCELFRAMMWVVPCKIEVNVRSDSFCYLLDRIFKIFTLNKICIIIGSLNNSDAFVYSWLVNRDMKKNIWHMTNNVWPHSQMFQESSRKYEGKVTENYRCANAAARHEEPAWWLW